MNRRNFLGSVIGTVLGTNFLAQLDTDPWQRVILPYRMTFFDSVSGFSIQAPGIQEIVQTGDTHKFIAETLDVHQTMALDSAMLYTEQGQLIAYGMFQSRIHLLAKDQINVFCDLHVPFEMTLEEAIKRSVKCR